MKTSVELKQEVIDVLRKDPMLASENIEADVICGNLFLSGKVSSYRKKFEAGKLVRSMYGAKNVHLNLHIDLPACDKKPDSAIRDTILNSLNSSIHENKISILVCDGVVVLTGDAEDEPQKIEAMDAVIDVPGILNVWDFIKVKNAITSSNERIKVISDNNTMIDTNKIRQ